MDKYMEMQNNEEWWSWADAIERGEVAAEMRMREKTENARQEGLREGLKEGLREGEIKGKLKGEMKGRIETLKVLIKTKYQISDENWILNLNELQLKNATAWILICNTYEQLKQKINMIV